MGEIQKTNVKVTDACVCKHFHIFYMTDPTRMCDLYGECIPFTNKLNKETCISFKDNESLIED